MPHLSPLETLIEMHTYCRPAGSRAERRFRNRFIMPLDVEIDPFGNLHKQIGDSPVIWSTHTDTVHRRQGRQRVHFDTHSGTLSLPIASRSSCLGADDTAGCWIMREMILAGVAGHYIFHYGEECGGIGSRALARECPALADGAIMAIAFDRKGTRDVITYQGSRTCSDMFAQSLADALNVHGLDYAPCDRGVYTDTAEYVDIIGECTNLSVGYDGAHTPHEYLDCYHLIRLLEAVKRLDMSALAIGRQPGDNDPDDVWSDDASWYCRAPRSLSDVTECPDCGLYAVIDDECHSCYWTRPTVPVDVPTDESGNVLDWPQFRRWLDGIK